MRVGCVISVRARLRVSLPVAPVSVVEAFNATQGLSHTRSSSPHSLVTRVQSQSVTRIITQGYCRDIYYLWLLRVVQSDLQDTLEYG